MMTMSNDDVKEMTSDEVRLDIVALHVCREIDKWAMETSRDDRKETYSQADTECNMRRLPTARRREAYREQKRMTG